MKYSLYLLVLLLSSKAIFCQNQEIYQFVKASALNVRSQPNLNSKIIGKVFKNDKVKIIQETKHYQKIDGLRSFWKQIQYKNIKGFVFGGFLTLDKIIENNTDSFEIVRGLYAELEYNPNLNWYGVYSTKEGDKIKPIIPSPYYNQKYLDFVGLSFYKDTTTNFHFYLGTRSKLKTGIVGVKKYYKNLWLRDNQTIDLILYNNEKEFSTGQQLKSTIVKCENGIYGKNSFKDYKLYYIKDAKNDRQETVLLYAPKENYLSLIPTLIWYGDIDNDGLPEFLFSVNGDNIEFIKIIRENGKLKAKKIFSKRPAFASGC